MSRDIRGFWASFAKNRRAVFHSWDIWCSLALAGVVALALPVNANDSILTNLGTAELSISSALFGVIIAGFAIIVVFLDKEYLSVLSRVGGGVSEDLFPFWYTAVLSVVSILVATSLLTVGPLLAETSCRILVGVSSWFFLYSLFAALNLVGEIVAHGILRSKQILKDDSNDAGRGKKKDA